MTDAIAALQDGLRASYLIERELGRGGTATVWLARDLKHDRPVALKVLHPDVAATIGPQRFLREIRLAARLHHPHILTVLDSGETAGRFWFTMPYVDAESLRDRLRRDGRLPIDVALRITREAALGLRYAHGCGVIHRDIKPENILITREGTTLVVDFGIARPIGEGSAEDHLTTQGLAIGTPAYMSPEQATADRALDARTDEYSLAVVCYEMLVGTPPHTGPTAAAVIGKRLSEDVPSVRITRPEVSLGITRALERALAIRPDDRFASVTEFVEALEAGRAGGWNDLRSLRPPRLRTLVGALALAAALVLGVVAGARWFGARGGAPRRLAVLPFDNLGNPSDAYFADGMTDAVRGKLAALPGVQVTSWSSSSQYRAHAKPLRAIGRELGVDYLLLGRVRWMRNPDGTSRVQVSPELISVATEAVAWQDGFDAALTDVFRVQADVAGRVAEALNVALGSSQREGLARRPTADLAAYDAYLKGEALSQQLNALDPPSLTSALGYYEQAVALDSTFVDAWVQLSRAQSYIYYLSSPAAAHADAARRAAERAVALAPDRPEGRLAMGLYYQFVRIDAAAALREYEAGLRVAPDDASLLSARSAVERDLGRWDAALEHARRAEALDPRSVRAVGAVAYAELWMRNYAAAQAACDRALALAPDNVDLVHLAVMVRIGQGDLDGARAVLREARAHVAPQTLITYVAVYFDLYWVLDDEQRAQLVALPPSAFDDRALWAMTLAQAWSLRGDTARVRAYADTALHAVDAQLRDTPDDAQRHVLRGLALAYLGRPTDAVNEGKRGTALLPPSKDAWTGAYLEHQLLRIQLLAGNDSGALDLLETLLQKPYFLSPRMLRIDPTFARLAGNPRFERLATAR